MKKKKYAALTQKYRDSSLQYFPNSRDNTSLFNGIIIKKGQETNHYNDYLYFPYFSFDPDRAVFAYIISHAYHQKDREREKWLAISISDLKLAKRKYFTAESGVLLYEEGDIDREPIHTTL
jgi:hypothetical protein